MTASSGLDYQERNITGTSGTDGMWHSHWQRIYPACGKNEESPQTSAVELCSSSTLWISVSGVVLVLVGTEGAPGDQRPILDAMAIR